MKYSIKFFFLCPLMAVFSLHGFTQSIEQQSHYPGYTFTIEKGVDSPSDALKLDNTLLLLKDMVLSAKTDPITKLTTVEVIDLRITYASLRYFLDKNGYKTSEKCSSREKK